MFLENRSENYFLNFLLIPASPTPQEAKKSVAECSGPVELPPEVNHHLTESQASEVLS
jgi:hypothetical protein